MIVDGPVTEFKRFFRNTGYIARYRGEEIDSVVVDAATFIALHAYLVACQKEECRSLGLDPIVRMTPHGVVDMNFVFFRGAVVTPNDDILGPKEWRCTFKPRGPVPVTSPQSERGSSMSFEGYAEMPQSEHDQWQHFRAFVSHAIASTVGRERVSEITVDPKTFAMLTSLKMRERSIRYGLERGTLDYGGIAVRESGEIRGRQQWRIRSVIQSLPPIIETAPPVDPVNHPPHYNQGSIECIDVLESIGVAGDFCRGNAIKYLYRINAKGNALQDTRKAKWYVDKLISILEREEKDSVNGDGENSQGCE